MNGPWSTLSICTPLALSSANIFSSDSCASLRCSAVASAAASWTTFLSACESLSQERLPIRNGVISYLWPVSEMYFCTSCSLPAQMLTSGFSCPSTTPCCSATYSSENLICCASAPTLCMMSTVTASGGVRIFRPFKSSGLSSGRLLLLIWRMPLSQ